MADEHITRIQKVGGIATAAFLILFPLAASGQVVVSEIMYKPNPNSGHEWVEVQNTGSQAVDLSYTTAKHWKLTANANDGGIKPYSGGNSIPAGGVAVLAVDPSTFLADWNGWSGILFDITSLTSLNDTGATLTVVDISGTVEDTVSYANTMGASGDGNSLQRSGGSWIAALPTPGAANAAGAAPPAAAEDSGSQTGSQTQTTQAPTSSYVAPPEPQIFADAGDNRTVIVAADTEFLGRAYNRNKETISDHVRFLWNFGDGRTAEGPSVMHHFEYPGRYAVVLNIAENADAASERIIVTAEPAKLAFTSLPDGSVVIKNNSGRDLDLSHWLVRSFGRSFTVPRDSIILAGESLRIGEKTLGFRSSPETELDYPNGVLALRAGTASGEADDKKAGTPVAGPVSANAPAAPRASPAFSDFAAEQTSDTASAIENSAGDTESARANSSQMAAAGAAISDSDSSYLWWLGAIGMAVAGGGAIVASRRAGKREWNIVEEREG